MKNCTNKSSENLFLSNQKEKEKKGQHVLDRGICMMLMEEQQPIDG
jgi:hypothetical protein